LLNLFKYIWKLGINLGWVLVVRYNTERVLIGFAVARDLGSQYLV